MYQSGQLARISLDLKNLNEVNLGLNKQITKAAIIETAGCLLLACSDNKVYSYDLKNNQLNTVLVYEGHNGLINDILYLPGKNKFLTRYSNKLKR